MMIDVKQFVQDRFEIKRDLYMYNQIEGMDYNDLVQLLIEFQQRLLQQTPCTTQEPPDGFVQSLRDLRSWVVSSEEVSYDEERAIRRALGDILYHLKNVKERRQLS